ncbi:MAG: efflux RND transporter periplasmic adaptor subunit [Spongiibacteraceae bacterium]
MTNLHLPALDKSTLNQPAADTPIPDNPRARRKRRNAAIALATLFGAAIGLRVIANVKDSSALIASTNAALERTVMITHAKPGALKSTLVLPTTLRGNSETTIVARSNGYVVSIKKDIGDSVKQGDVLATISAPEQDQELAQAQANYAQTKERADLAQLTADRYESLRLKDGITQHELEEKRSELRQARSNLAAAQAEVNRLDQLRGLRSIAAPFSGVITHRSIDIGDLVTAGNKALFTLTQIDPLKLTIWVPQANAGQIKIGQTVKVELNEHQHDSFDAKVDRVAGGIDTQTRSRQVDLVLPNADGKLLPGAYAEANIELANGTEALVAPSSVLISTSEGFQVAVVDKENRIAFRDIKIGRDLGREIEVLHGIEPSDTLIVSPSDLLVEGETVKTLAWEPKKKDGDKKSANKSNTAIKDTTDKNEDTKALTKS